MKQTGLHALLLVGLALGGCGDDPQTAAPQAGGEHDATKIALDKWSQVGVPGFKQTSGKVAGAGALSTYRQIAKTGGGAAMQVRVTFAPCTPSTCRPLKPDATNDLMRMRENLNRKHASNPKLKWDTGLFEIAPGRQAMFLWTRSYMEEKQEGGTRRLTAHFFHAWYHDGKHLIDFAVEARDGTRVTSDATLARQMTPDEATRAVQAIFKAFAGAFES